MPKHQKPHETPKDQAGRGNHKRNRRKQNQSGGDNHRKISHALSWALRHAAPTIGLTITPAGWVPVQEILDSKHPRLKPATNLEAIESVVRTSEKRRFALSMQPISIFPQGKVSGIVEEDATEILCIRANQGHSIKTIEAELLLTKLSPEELMALPCIVHGTYAEPWKLIEQNGLRKMNRNHIHFATGVSSDEGVLSGMRKSSSVHIFIDAKRCAEDGVEFFQSANGVVLTAGIDGILPPLYFSKVTSSDGTILYPVTSSDDKPTEPIKEA